MGIVIRQSVSSTIIAYAGAVIGYINLLYLFPKFLSPEQVGLLRAITDAAILLAPFAQFGLAQSIFRYYPQMVKKPDEQAPFINLILLLGALGFGLFLLVFHLFEGSILSYFSDNAKELIGYSSVVLWLTFIVLITALMEAYSRSLLKTIFPNFLREILIRLLLSLFVILYFEKVISYHQLIIAVVLSYLLCLALLLAYLVMEKSFAISFRFSALEKNKMKDLLKYSLLSFAGSAAMIIVGKIDSLMVSGLAGLRANAVYTTAFYMAAVIEFPKRALSQVAMPIISRAFEKNAMNDIATIYRKTAINQAIIGCLLLIGIFINLDNIFSLIPKSDVYSAGKWVVLLVGIGKLADMTFGPSSEIIVLSKYYAFNVVLILLLAASVIMANNVFIPAYGINGAALGSAMALILFNGVKFIFILLKFKMQPFSRATAYVVLISMVCVGVHFAIPRLPHTLLDIAARSTIISLVYGSLIFVSKASPDLNALMTNVLKKYWQRQ
jgi:O-antigen/teichoic acid export membrane protein